MFPLAALAFVAPSLALAQKVSSGPTVIPGGSYTTPYAINAPGSYVLGGNRSLSDVTKNVIEINAPDVTLDLGGYALSQPVGSANTGCGIMIASTDNVEIRNGAILDPANCGILAKPGKALRVLDVRIVAPHTAGILSAAADTAVSRCAVSDSTTNGIDLSYNKGGLVTGCVVSGCANFGVQVTHGGRIEHTIARDCQVGVWVWEGSTVANCTVTGSKAWGVTLGGHSVLRDSDIVGCSTGIYGDNYGNPGVVKGTSILNCQTTSYYSYTDGGGNVIQ